MHTGVYFRVDESERGVAFRTFVAKGPRRAAVIPFHRDEEVTSRMRATARADMAFSEREQARGKQVLGRNTVLLKFKRTQS